MEKNSFRKRLYARQKAINSVLCAGLDPLVEKLPTRLRQAFPTERAVAEWMCEIVDATAPYVCMFKPQRAHYEAFQNGRSMLQYVVGHIRSCYPDIPIFLDCKRGDIGRTQKQYRISHLEIDGVDGMNFNPYMGMDTMEALVDKTSAGSALVGLCRTSNSSAWMIQDCLLQDGRRLWEHVGSEIFLWSKQLGIREDTGLVMGAAHATELMKGNPWHAHLDNEDAMDWVSDVYDYPLKRIREIVGDALWLLIPGIGKQKGASKETVQASFVGPGSIAINVSSAICLSQTQEEAEKVAQRYQEEFLASGADCCN